MLIALPLLTFIALYLVVHHSQRTDASTPADWRGSFFIASILWGTLVVLITEGLSLIKAIGRLEVAVLWITALIFTATVGIRKRVFRSAISSFQFRLDLFTTMEWLIIIGLSVMVFLLALLAWIAPPNNSDSLAYHLPRIVHWIQNRSLQHYPTAFHPQLLTSYFPETAILQFWLLWGGDRVANMIQWFSMLGSLIAVTAIAKRFGANRTGSLFAACFAISVPIGVLQSTSTQTDYVTTFWLLCLIYLILLSKRRELLPVEMVSLMLVSGLGILTKGTFYTFSTPFLLWFFVPRLRKDGLRKTFLLGIGLLLVMLALNTGFFLRNIDTYGGPLGSGEWLAYKTEARLTPQSWISAGVKQLALNFATPRLDFNEGIISFVHDLDHNLGITEEPFNFIWAWNQEDLAGNPLHAILLIGATPLVFIAARKWSHRSVYQYALAFLGAVFLHVVVVMFDIHGVRHQLTIFIMGAPLLGVLFSSPRLVRSTGILSILFLFLALPWVLFNSTRPFIALRPDPEPWSLKCKYWCTRTGSIFTHTRDDLLFTNWPGLREPISEIAEIIRADRCDSVGLRIDSHDMEYLYQWSLGAPQNEVHFETIYTFPVLERYLDPGFKPCAVICTICKDQGELDGLTRVYSYEDHSLYMDSHSPEQ